MWSITMEMKTIMKNRSSISEANIPRCRHRHRNKYTRHKKVSIRWCLHVLSNNEATFEAQFIKKLNNTDSELKKRVAFMKTCISLMDNLFFHLSFTLTLNVFNLIEDF